ncbi:hypothetical protein TNCV_3314741 [Trichonephila clavipes]|nr:hypothetical protein TNCV_3314741 [Trichonephila clavipes]
MPPNENALVLKCAIALPIGQRVNIFVLSQSSPSAIDATHSEPQKDTWTSSQRIHLQVKAFQRLNEYTNGTNVYDKAIGIATPQWPFHGFHHWGGGIHPNHSVLIFLSFIGVLVHINGMSDKTVSD